MPIVSSAPAARAYEGPECPRCKARLTADWIRSGIISCPDCRRTFEATAFNPPQPRLRVAEVTMTPEGANTCANHARNAAVTSCQRCGLFICALCDMSVGSGSYCPACFDRLRAEGSLKGTNTRYRDYGRMALISLIVGVPFLGAFGLGAMFGVASLIYANKARQQRKAEERSTVGVAIVSVLAMLEIAGGLTVLALMVLAIAGALK